MKPLSSTRDTFGSSLTLGSNPSRAHAVQSPRDLNLRGPGSRGTHPDADVGAGGGFVIDGDDADSSDGGGVGSGDVVGGLDTGGGGVYDGGVGAGAGMMPGDDDDDEEEEEYMDLGLDDFGGLDLGSGSGNSDDAF